MIPLALVLALFSLSAEAAPEPISNPGTFVQLSPRKWFTLDPADAADSVSFIVVGNVYESLITFKRLDTPDEFLPFLAARVPAKGNGLLSADGKVYRFPIRAGVKFHEGQTLSAEDVRYSLLRYMLQDTAGASATLLLNPILGLYGTRGPDGRISLDYKEAEKAVSVDGEVVVIRLKRPNGHFLRILASLPIVVSKSWAVSHGEWDGTEATWKRYNNRPMAESYLQAHANGTGPFALKEADPDSHLMLKRHEQYWRTPAALTEILMRIVPNKALRLWMLENGDADASYLEDQDYAEAKQIPGVKVVDCNHHTVLGETLFFTFAANPTSEFLGSGRLDGAGIPTDFFKDRDIREGFAYALDYEGILRRGLGMRGKRARGPFPDAFLPEQTALPYRFDLAKASAAFKAARGGEVWEKGFTLSVALSPTVAYRRILAEFLKAGLEKINPKFKIRIKSMPTDELYTAAEKHSLPLFITGFNADYPDNQSVASGMLHSAGYFPSAQGYANADMDHLVEEADVELDPAKRRTLYLRIGKKANEDLVQVYIYNPTRFKAMRTWVRENDVEQNVNNLNLNNFPYYYSVSKG